MLELGYARLVGGEHGSASADAVENVLGVSMPSRCSSEHSKDDARALAENLGIEYLQLPIEPVFQAYLETLALAFEGYEPDVTVENLPATRARRHPDGAGEQDRRHAALDRQ